MTWRRGSGRSGSSAPGTRPSSTSSPTSRRSSKRCASEKRRITEAEFLPGSLTTGIRFQECFNDDPLLPPELLPRPWPGRTARDLLIRCRRSGVLLREEHDKPQLFAPWDDLLLSLRN